MRGTYALILHVPFDLQLKVGELGVRSFREGYYAYVGSALSGVEGRVRRHLRKEKPSHWHIDYLRMRAVVVDLVKAESRVRKECRVAKELADLPSVLGFGSSDCRCTSHLFYHPDRHTLTERVIRAFRKAGLRPERGWEPLPGRGR
ncbi:MAG: GIY-YIG nuclease family protein [Candidatus Hadarchaeales archaeon]